MLLEEDEQACLPLVAGHLVPGSTRGVQVSTEGASSGAGRRALAVPHILMIQASCTVFINVKRKCFDFFL